jgi:hypothetical protein
MSEPTENEEFLRAFDALLTTVAKSSDDLRLFHDTVAKAPLSPVSRFPRATIILTERIVDRLTKLEKDLEEVLVALGLSHTEPPADEHDGHAQS